MILLFKKVEKTENFTQQLRVKSDCNYKCSMYAGFINKRIL